MEIKEKIIKLFQKIGFKADELRHQEVWAHQYKREMELNNATENNETTPECSV